MNDLGERRWIAYNALTGTVKNVSDYKNGRDFPDNYSVDPYSFEMVLGHPVHSEYETYPKGTPENPVMILDDNPTVVTGYFSVPGYDALNKPTVPKKYLEKSETILNKKYLNDVKEIIINRSNRSDGYNITATMVPRDKVDHSEDISDDTKYAFFVKDRPQLTLGKYSGIHEYLGVYDWLEDNYDTSFDYYTRDEVSELAPYINQKEMKAISEEEIKEQIKKAPYSLVSYIKNR